jgi:hypothetical protein
MWWMLVRHLLTRAVCPPHGLPHPLRNSYADGIEWKAIGFVGGIESIAIDDRRWWFGFDFSNDTAISPLIDDPDMMAAFASRYMLQADGVHGRKYWRAQVEVDRHLGLAGDENQRTFATSEFRRIASGLPRRKPATTPFRHHDPVPPALSAAAVGACGPTCGVSLRHPEYRPHRA